MALLSDAVHVRVPATSANLGPGFDSLGLALSRHDDVTAWIAPGGVRVEVTGEGAGELPTDGTHLVARAMSAAFDALGEQPPGLRIRCVNRIPQARGLGSSSAAIVAGLLAARALSVDGAARLADAAVLALASDLEGHPDNVAPCLLGGLTIAWLDAADAADAAGVAGAAVARAVKLTPAASIAPVVFVPATRGLTAQARAALPREVPHADAAFNAGRAALLVHALTAAPDALTTTPGLLLAATEDRLHQHYRAPANPESADLLRLLRSVGIPAVISGAGPTVLAFVRDGDTPPDPGPAWLMWQLCVDATGATVVAGTIGHAERDPVAAGRES
jgi:homoserine kinase